jgi:MFS family permease
LVTVKSLTAIVASVAAGYCVDRFPLRSTMMIALALAAGAQGTFLLAHTVPHYVTATLLSAIATALFPPVVILLMAGLARELRGVFISLSLVLPAWLPTTFVVVSTQVGKLTAIGWRASFALSFAALSAVCALAMLTMRSPSWQRTDVESYVPDTLSPRATLNLLIASALLMAFIGGLTGSAYQLFGKNIDAYDWARVYSAGTILFQPITIAIAVCIAFMRGGRAILIARLISVVVGLAILATVLAAVSSNTTIVLYCLAFVQGCGLIALGGVLTAIACWTAISSRGLNVGIAYASKGALGFLLAIVLNKAALTLSDTMYRCTIAGLALVLGAWALVHTWKMEQEIKRTLSITTHETKGANLLPRPN